MTAAAAARNAELCAQLRKESATARVVNPPSRFSTVPEFQLEPRRDRRKLLRSGNDDAPCTANRLAHMPNVQAGMVARMPCKCCRKKKLVASAKHEIQQGLHSVLGLWCTECRQVTEWVPLSELLPSGRRGPDLAAIHVRAQMGMAEAGIDRASARKLSLDALSRSRPCWYRASGEPCGRLALLMKMSEPEPDIRRRQTVVTVAHVAGVRG